MRQQDFPDYYLAHPSVIKFSGNNLLGKAKRKKRIALVTQGGGQRGIFTAGVLDSFISSGFDPFELYLGTSAGALNLTSYLTRNYGFAYRFITELTTQNQFFNLIKYVRRQQLMDLEWAFEQMNVGDPSILNVENARTLLKNRRAYACATDAGNFKAQYFPMFQDNWIEVLKASSAIPLLFKGSVEIDGRKYIDGGVSASIPVREAFNLGADIVVVIRTEITEADEKPISSSFVENVRSSVEQHLPSYLSKFDLENRLDKLSKFHTALSGKIQKLHQKYTENAWEQIMDKMPDQLIRNGGRWLFGGDSIYRLQALSGQKINLKMASMLTQHFQSYQECVKFLAAPPARLQVIQICPSAPLASNPLLSKKTDLIQDYYDGVGVGQVFVQHLGEALEDISNLSY